VTATSDNTTVSINVTGSIPTVASPRAKRTAEENNIERGGQITATASSFEPGFPASNAIDMSAGGDYNNNSKFGHGAKWKALDGTGNGQYIEIDFGAPATFDYMAFVHVKQNGTIYSWSVDVWDDAGGVYVTQVSPGISQWETLGPAPQSPGGPPPLPYFSQYSFWVAVNFLKSGLPTSADTDNCDDDDVTGDGSDHCVGVLTPGTQTSSKVKITINNLTAGKNASLDWIQFKKWRISHVGTRDRMGIGWCRCGGGRRPLGTSKRFRRKIKRIEGIKKGRL